MNRINNTIIGMIINFLKFLFDFSFLVELFFNSNDCVDSFGGSFSPDKDNGGGTFEINGVNSLISEINVQSFNP